MNEVTEETLVTTPEVESDDVNLETYEELYQRKPSKSKIMT